MKVSTRVAAVLATTAVAATSLVAMSAPSAHADVLQLYNSKSSDMTAIVWKSDGCLGSSAHVQRGSKAPFTVASFWKPAHTKATLGGTFVWKSESNGRCVNLPSYPIATLKLDKD
jgi:hypothetical protein